MSKSEDPSTLARRSNAPRIDVCPLCREPVAEHEAGTGDVTECRACRFQFAAETPEPAAPEPEPAPAAAEAVLEKWLSGAPWEPARRSPWRHAAVWIRGHRTLTASAAILAAAAILSVTQLYGTSKRLEESLRQTTFERDDALARCERLQAEAAEFAQSVDEHVEQSFRAAERKLRVSIAQEVAAEAAGLSNRQPEHGLAMATIALRMAHRENAPPIVPALELVYGLSTRPIDQTGASLGHIDVLAISPDGTRLATADADGHVRLVDPAGRAKPLLLPGRLNHVAALEFSSDGVRLVARSVDSTVNIWKVDGDDVETQERTVLKVSESRMASSTVSDDGRWILTGCNGFRPGETTVRLWDVAGRNPSTNYFDLPGNRGRVQSVAVSRSGQWVAAGNHGGSIALWNTAKHPLRGVTHVLTAGKHGVNSLHFTPDERKLVSSEGTDGGDCTIRIWDLTTGDPAESPTVLEGHVAPVRKLAVSANGRCAASADDTGRVCVWNLDVPANEALVTFVEAHVDSVTALEFGADGRRLYSAGVDGRVCIWDLTRVPLSKPLVRLKIGESAVTGLAVCRDGSRLAAASADQHARLWEVNADDLLRWAHDGSRRSSGDAEAPVAAAKQADEPPARSGPVIETAGRPDLNPLR